MTRTVPWVSNPIKKGEIYKESTHIYLQDKMLHTSVPSTVPWVSEPIKSKVRYPKA